MDEQRIFLRPPVWLPLLVVVVGGLFYIAGKKVEARYSRPPGVITVSGDARVFAAPDIAEMSLGIQTGRQPTAGAAMERLKEGMDRVIAAVKAQGIEEKDIRTENFWLNPVYDYADGRQIPRGFEASQSLRVKVRDLDKVSDVLGAGTNAGANQAGSVTFTLDDPDGKRADARAEAIAEARQKAKLLADQLHMQLGKIQNFNEGFGGGTPPIFMREAYGMGGGGDMADKAVQLPAGEQEIVVNVTIVYEIR